MKKMGQLEEEKQFDTNKDDHTFSDKYQIKKQRLLNSLEKGGSRKHKFRSISGAAAAAVLILALSATVYAAVKIISVNIWGEKDSVIFVVNADRNDYIPPIEITPGYLPEGYREWMPDKYSPGGEWGANGLTIIDVGYIQKSITMDVSGYEEVPIGEARGLIIERKGYEYPWQVFLFYEEDGHVIEVFGCDALSREEILKVCEGVTYREAPELDTNGIYQAFSSDHLNDYLDENGRKKEVIWKVSHDDIREINQSFESGGIKYTVTDIKITDTVNTSLLAKENTLDYDQVKQHIQEDGTFIPFNRTVAEWKDNELQIRSLGSVPVKNVEITIYLENTKEKDNDDVFVGPHWTKIKESEDSEYQITEDIPGYTIDESFRYFNHYEIGYELPYYFDSSYYPEDHHFFYMTLKAGEKKEVHVWMAIPEDELEQAYIGVGSYYTKVKD